MREKIFALTMILLSAVRSAPLGAQDPPSRFQPAEVVSAVEPVYPLNTVYPGTVVLEVTIGPLGEVQNVKVVRDAPGFTTEAQRAIRKWRFRPARLDGEPIRSVMPVAFSFSQPLVWQSTAPK